MSSNRELYKFKSRSGLGSRETRARLKTQESKNSRDALLFSKRRIPLSSVQEEPPRKKDTVSQNDLRLQKLKEWKKVRDEARQKEKQTKKKPFVTGGGRPGTMATNSTQVQTKHSNPKSLSTGRKTAAENIPSNSKSSVTTHRGKDAANKPVPATTKEAKAAAASTSSNAPRNLSRKPPPPNRVTTREEGVNSRPREEGVNTRLREKRVTTKPPTTTTTTRASKRIAQREKQPPAKKPATKPGKKDVKSVRVTRGSSTKAKDTISKVKGTKETSSGPSTSSKRRVKIQTPVKTQLSYSESSSDSNDTSPHPSSSTSPQSHPPPPSSPSPVPHNPGAIPDCAWVPNNHVFTRYTCTAFKSVDDILGPCTFSPFKFTAGNPTGCGLDKSTDGGKSIRKNTLFKFSFRKTVDVTPLSLQAEAAVLSEATLDSVSVDSLDCSQTPVAPPVAMDTDPVGTTTELATSNVCQTPVPSPVCYIAMDTDPVATTTEPATSDIEASKEEQHVPCNAPPDGSEAETGCVEENNLSTDSDKGDVDVSYFRKLHDDVVDIFTEKCSLWKAKGEAVEREREAEPDEERQRALQEAVDQIRTTVCQAELLMRKKMKQYLGLVDNAENDGGKTTAEDLQGFWDLVSIQIDDVHRKFDSLTELEQNNWNQPQLERAPAKKKGKKRAPASRPGSDAATSERQAAARERRNAMRNRLKEMKMEAARRAREEGKEGEENKMPDSTDEKQTTPPRDDGHHDNGSCHSSKRKSTGKNRRRSRRLGKRTSMALIDFSETPVQAPPQPSSPHPPPDPFSPTPAPTSIPTVSTGLQTAQDVPTADLLTFGNQSGPNVPPLKSPLKWVPKGMSRTPVKNSVPTGASVRRFVSITPSKKIRDMLDADVIMSPARRSLRLAEKCDTPYVCNHGNYQVASLRDLPVELDIGYLPNKALF